MDASDRKSLIKLAIIVAIVACSVAGIAKAPDIIAAISTANAVEAAIDEPAEPAPASLKPDLGSGSTSTGG